MAAILKRRSLRVITALTNHKPHYATATGESGMTMEPLRQRLSPEKINELLCGRLNYYDPKILQGRPGNAPPIANLSTVVTSRLTAY
jgi:hypothetical protein